MEHELRKHLRKNKAPTLNDGVKQALVVNEDVQFLWSMISADWEEASASTLLQMIVNQWVKIRGFSHVGAWVELLKRKLHRNPKVFRNSYFLDQIRHQWTLLKKLNYYYVHITLA